VPIKIFVGKAEHTINKDGRLSIPSKMRDIISKQYDPEDLYLFLLPGDTICLYPGEEFAELIESLENPSGDALSSALDIDRICADAEPCKLDGSGRIVIPPKMREDAKIGQDVLIVGVKNHIEIWDPVHWDWSRRQIRSGIERLRKWAQSDTSPQTA